MTARTTRIAAVGAGSLLALGLFTSPAFASDGAQAGASVSAGTADAVSQTLDVVNKACADAANVTGTATSATGSLLGTDSGISVAAQPAGNALGLSVSLPALPKTLSGLGSLPVVGSLPAVGSLSTQAQAAPLDISCATSADGGGVGLSAAGVDALIKAIAPGIDLSGINLPAGLSLAAGGNVTGPAPAAAPAPAGQVSATTRTAASPTVRAGASAAQPTAAANLSATPASTSSSSGLPGALARTGAGVSLLALLGAALFGSGRLLGFARKFIRVGS